ncbi:hypothetical protein HYU22_00625 [Candidatus Woesearchaeota archaeon]|nr:hypothetical protein [Candidatus Woesearchaeota archaeon]
MLIIKHRVNTVEELKQTPPEFGVEIDLRPEGNRIILHHDPFVPGTDFEEWLKHYHHAFLILDIKSEGIEKYVIELMKKHHFTDYFLLDVTPPFLTKLAKEGVQNLSARFSTFESIKTGIKYGRAFPGQIPWIFIDVMGKKKEITELPLDKRTYSFLKSQGYKLCLVSPELLGREDKIKAYQNTLKRREIILDAVLTKRPEAWLP